MPIAEGRAATAGNNNVVDHAFIGYLTPPWNPRGGHYHWNIPNAYSVGAAGTQHVFETTLQSFDIDATGRVTVAKGGRANTVSASAPASGQTEGALERYATVAEAKHMVSSLPGPWKSKLNMALSTYRNFRTVDPESARNIALAIQELNFNLYVRMEATNSYHLASADNVRMAIHGMRTHEHPDFNLESGTDRAGKHFQVAMNDMFDWTGFDQQSIEFTIAVDGWVGHGAQHTLAWPYMGLLHAVPLAGLDNRFTLQAYVDDT